MTDSLYEYLNFYAKQDIYPFHMPGHKRNTEFLDISNPVSIDLTEIESTDNLQNPTGLIAKLQNRMAEIFTSDEAFISVNGATGCVISSILSAVKEGEKIIMARNSHMSAYSALFFSKAAAEFVYPEISAEGIPGFISAEKISEAFKKSPNAKAVFITSPTYEGITSDIGKIAEIAHNHGALLIVDEAHGSHFPFHERFPKSAVSQGADIVIQSLHKTLPALTSSALVHVKGERADRRLLRIFLNMVNSSSPSYVVLSSIDKCADFLENKRDSFMKFYDLLEKYRNKLSSFNNLCLVDDKYLYESFGKIDFSRILDISKLVFIHKKNIENFDFEKCLRNLGIELEYSSKSHFIALSAVADKEIGFYRLLSSLEKIDKELDFLPDSEINFTNYPQNIEGIRYADGIYARGTLVELTESVGKICAKSIIPYPPGIPIILPGEIISEEIVLYLKNFGISFIEIMM